MEKAVVILGPTATGKTKLAVGLCQQFNGEIVSADSRQVYRHADIGTNKRGIREKMPKKGRGYWVKDGVKINLYDLVEPKERYSASRFINDASEVLRRLRREKKSVFIVGGTGFYISALLGETKLSGVPANPHLREKLAKYSPEKLQQVLGQLDPGRLRQMNNAERRNPHRLIRAIEIAGAAPKDGERLPPRTAPLPPAKILKIGLGGPRELMYHRADRWAHRIVMSEKLIAETKDLLKRGAGQSELMRGIIYAPTVDYLNGKINQPELVQTVQRQLHGYIRRQLTFFKRDPRIRWFNTALADFDKEVGRLVKSFLENES